MKRRLTSILVLGLFVSIATASWAANGNIGLFFDADASRCTQHIACFDGPQRLYVFGLLQGASQLGITGAEYKIRIGADDSADPGWVFLENFDPSATVIGTGACNPVDNAVRGVNVAWGDCQLGDGVKVLIETVDIFNLNNCGPSELYLTAVKRDNPTNQFFQCPLFVLCDAPTYTKVCLGSNLTVCQNPEPPFAFNATCSTSGQAIINPFEFHNCTVAVQPASWSSVKSLYN